MTWALDGLEVTIVGALGSVLEEPGTLGLSATDVGLAGTAYIAGAIAGALIFGHLTDRHGRRRLFLITLSLYVLATCATALSVDFWTFAACRFLTGMGIGGEYAAINSAIDELIPARTRGFADLAINGSYWLGTALGAVLSAVLLDPRVLGHELGWRAAFGLGAALALGIMIVRRFVPESPRWLMVRGRHAEADAIVAAIEASCAPHERAGDLPRIRIAMQERIGFATIARVMLSHYRSRALFGLVLMVAQAFFYNAIFFTYALTLTRFYAVPADSIGRRPMIAFTYAMSGTLLLLTGIAFARGALDAQTHTLLWSVSFFFASAAASSAYLTVSELFPLELRAMAIALFYAVGTGVGGLVGPVLFGALIESGSRHELFLGYLLGSTLMWVAALTALVLGVAAERRPLEEIAQPLSLVPHDG